MVQLPCADAVDYRCILIRVRIARLVRSHIEMFEVRVVLQTKHQPREATLFSNGDIEFDHRICNIKVGKHRSAAFQPQGLFPEVVNDFMLRRFDAPTFVGKWHAYRRRNLDHGLTCQRLHGCRTKWLFKPLVVMVRHIHITVGKPILECGKIQ